MKINPKVNISQIYSQTVEIPGIKIFHYSGSLNFASKQYFREEMYKVAELVPQKEFRKLQAACNGIAVEEIKKVNNVQFVYFFKTI